MQVENSTRMPLQYGKIIAFAINIPQIYEIKKIVPNLQSTYNLYHTEEQDSRAMSKR